MAFLVSTSAFFQSFKANSRGVRANVLVESAQIDWIFSLIKRTLDMHPLYRTIKRKEPPIDSHKQPGLFDGLFGGFEKEWLFLPRPKGWSAVLDSRWHEHAGDAVVGALHERLDDDEGADDGEEEGVGDLALHGSASL